MKSRYAYLAIALLGVGLTVSYVHHRRTVERENLKELRDKTKAEIELYRFHLNNRRESVKSNERMIEAMPQEEQKAFFKKMRDSAEADIPGLERDLDGAIERFRAIDERLK